METCQVAKIVYYVPQRLLHFENYTDTLKIKQRPWLRILLTLVKYVVYYSKRFDNVSLGITSKSSTVFPNGTWTGVYGLLNQSKFDIGLPPIVLKGVMMDASDYSYPYTLTSYTFLIPNSQYELRIFSILQTFRTLLWIAILLAIIGMILAYYVILKRKYSLRRICLHVFAVLVRQSSIIVPFSTAEKLLFCTWVVGAMFLCLAFDSVFLSFLAFPPAAKFKDATQLAAAVANGKYHCVSYNYGLHDVMKQSNLESLRILGKDIKKNLKDAEFMKAFSEGKIDNFAFVTEAENAHMYDRVFFVSEDRFLELMAAMPVRKGFCCKELLNTFVHRLMASGLYFKYMSDSVFLMKLPSLLKFPEVVNSKKKLTLTDLAPAFIVLLVGYLISFIVFIAEILLNYWKKRNSLNKTLFKKRRKRKINIEDSV